MARYFTCRNPKEKITYKSEHLELDKLETNLLRRAIYSLVKNRLKFSETYLKKCYFK